MWPCPCWWLFVLLAPCSLGKGEARGWAFGSPLLLLHLECRVPALPKGRDATREAVHILSRHQCTLMVRETKLLLVSCPDLSLTCFRLPSPGGGMDSLSHSCRVSDMCDTCTPGTRISNQQDFLGCFLAGPQLP